VVRLCEPFRSDSPRAYFGAPQGALCTPVEERCFNANRSKSMKMKASLGSK